MIVQPDGYTWSEHLRRVIISLLFVAGLILLGCWLWDKVRDEIQYAARELYTSSRNESQNNLPEKENPGGSYVLATEEPTEVPAGAAVELLTPTPSPSPTVTPSPTVAPSPSPSPTATPTETPTPVPTVAPTLTPTLEPTNTPEPTAAPLFTEVPTVAPTPEPTKEPTCSCIEDHNAAALQKSEVTQVKQAAPPASTQELAVIPYSWSIVTDYGPAVGAEVILAWNYEEYLGPLVADSEGKVYPQLSYPPDMGEDGIGFAVIRYAGYPETKLRFRLDAVNQNFMLLSSLDSDILHGDRIYLRSTVRSVDLIPLEDTPVWPDCYTQECAEESARVAFHDPSLPITCQSYSEFRSFTPTQYRDGDAVGWAPWGARQVEGWLCTQQGGRQVVIEQGCGNAVLIEYSWRKGEGSLLNF